VREYGFRFLSFQLEHRRLEGKFPVVYRGVSAATKIQIRKETNMRRMMVVFVPALAVIAMTSDLARAQSIRTGGLTCDTGPRVGLVVGSRQNLRCVFRSNTSGQEYIYTGRIGRIGIDLGITGGGRLFWAVFAPTSRVRRGTLVGTYVGASGNAALGVGLGANVLIGGSNRTISLQPLSVEGQFGVNLALGVSRLTLR
jgi:uncharacterized protein DUF992